MCNLLFSVDISGLSGYIPVASGLFAAFAGLVSEKLMTIYSDLYFGKI
ncbi:hypothetical protein LJC10_02185 [Selenomonadales bacterium OttesenSCG-928-I06]|nr:hypothetical protein [Selenomonadales bacterium OttesenSCG-928-I06]